MKLAERRHGGRVSTLCRHCHEAVICRPRRLCWGCYYAREVRELYPPTSKYARRGPGVGVFLAPLPAFPTDALPGTPEKIAELERRALMRQALFHPGDATFAGPARAPQRAG
ncbi:MAG: hypothetical protein U0793_14650 [Gemmataceae bacterium]